MSWQVQEAKQRFSEVLRAVHEHGPQTISRHGADVAVIVDIEEYRRLTAHRHRLAEVLLGPPYLDDNAASVFDEVEAERKADVPREIDLDAGG